MPSLETDLQTEPHPPPTPPGQTVQTVAADGPDLTIAVHRHDDQHIVVVDVTGDLDALTAPRLLDTLGALLRERSAVLVVDLTAVAFMGSAGISVLVATHQHAGPHTHLRVVAATRVILRPLQVTGVDTVLNVYPSRVAAIAWRANRA
ncbi:MAG TPA: STAS domain-containing protein [Actinophytocola sp.]|uniref:STAS domain-containing protein n=1 Tax=Actinophytocola sp. TaxID=1872138 RepID=UPI002DB841D0|nr:STAS domain-containing protein [Actinophytocola sp.]HEU5475906.1 STAS domain-containing protein [Actinophytocola sp.]